MHIDRFEAMTTQIVLAAEGRKERVRIGFREARAVIRDGELRFTRFSADSELSRLNRTAGRWTEVTPDMYDMLSAARSLIKPTQGLFNPAVLPALVASGYDRSIELLEEEGPGPSIPSMNDVSLDFGAMELEPDSRRVKLMRGVQIDLGGIAKGWLATKAAKALADYADGCAVSAGGDIALVGLPNGTNAWSIGLEDPLQPDRDLTTLNVQSGSVATSSVVKRKWSQGGRMRHHIIDPRSGKPADTPWLSVTVLADDACEAEAFAKACLIGGPQLAPQLVEGRPGMSYLAVNQNGELEGTYRSQEYSHVAGLEI